MKLAAASSSFLAIFKLLLQIKRAAKKPNRNRRILRFSSSVCHDVFPSFLLTPDSLSPSLLHTGKQKCFQITFHIILFAFYCRESRVAFPAAPVGKSNQLKKRPKLSAFSDFYMPRRGCRLSAYAQRHKSLGVVMVKLQYEIVRGLIRKFMLYERENS